MAARTASLARALGLSFVFGLACNGGTDLALEITIPGDLVLKTKWFEAAAYRDTDCEALKPLLMNGLPEGLTARAAFEKDKDGPVFGKLPDGAYAFAAVARDKECKVLARGCTQEPDVSGASKVSIDLKKVDGDSGKCAVGTSCQAARCVPANDNADPSVGAGCSLELVGAGPLLHIAEGGALMSAPAIAATSTGFVIAYRESAGGGGAARLILLPIDSAGGLYGADKRDLSFEQVPILQQCGRQDETDGIGMLMAGENGMLVIANSCGTSPTPSSPNGENLQIVPFTVTEDPDNKKNLLATPTRNFLAETGVPVRLGAARSAAGSLAVFTQGNRARIAQLSVEEASKNVAGVGDFGGDQVSDAWIAANEQVLALLSLGGAPPPGDAGLGSGEGPTLSLLMVGTKTVPLNALGTITSPDKLHTFSGSWASLNAVGASGRVLVMSNGAGAGESVSIRAFDLGKEDESDSTGFSVEGDDDVTAGDVATFGNRAFFAALKPGIIELHAFDGATTKLSALGSVALGREPRISGIKNVGDGRVAVAASSTRVAVAWTTKKQLDDRDNDPAGGYAVFACTP